MKLKYKCPWCGCDFGNGKELDDHAKQHYIEMAIST